MQFTVEEVKNKKGVKEFVRFPHHLYKESKLYVPPIDNAEIKILTASPSLNHSTIKMWVARSSKGEVVGRIAAIINDRANLYHNEKRIRFGWFDFVDSSEVAEALLEKVVEMGRDSGMEEMHGPLGYNTWNKQGMLIEGFENLPPINCLYNYSYYPEIMDKLGMEKQFDWVQVKVAANEGIPEKIHRINQMLMEKYKLRVLPVEELKKNKSYIKGFFDSYNKSFSEIENFVPLTDEEVDEIASEYIPKLKEGLTSVVVDEDNNIAAFGICFPNLSKSFQKAKGRLFPFGFIHVLKEMRRYDTIDLMLLGAAPPWQNKGISSIYHTHIGNTLEQEGVEFAITNPQDEKNSAFKVWERYNYEPYMKRRCYIKKI